MSIKKAKKRARKKVLVGLSGGVDSAVAACLLKRAGYEVTGVHMRYWAFNGGNGGKKVENKCCSADAMTRAAAIAKKIGIPLLVMDMEKDFKKKVVDYFTGESKKNLTPNPCVECNRRIKFGVFMDKMRQLGADFVATGHYARILKTSRGGHGLFAAGDKSKDQSYFLYTLTQAKLKRILFPLGNLKKSEVRRLAAAFGIGEANNQKESQDLCFLPGKTAASFLRRTIGSHAAPGPIVTAEGTRLGTHSGLPFYTIGQRKGIGVGGIRGMAAQENSPWYVVRRRKAGNILVVGRENELYGQEIRVKNLSFPCGRPARRLMRVSAKIRFGSPLQEARLIPDAALAGRAKVIFDIPQRAAAPGQSVVFYRGNRVLGGGIIAS